MDVAGAAEHSFFVPGQPATAAYGTNSPLRGCWSAEKADHLSTGFSAIMAYLSPINFGNRTLINLFLSASDAREASGQPP